MAFPTHDQLLSEAMSATIRARKLAETAEVYARSDAQQHRTAAVADAAHVWTEVAEKLLRIAAEARKS